jgi:hypothetical protein
VVQSCAYSSSTTHKNDLFEVMIIFDLFEGLVKDDVDEALSY